ncbi:hypothetical protein G9C98_008512 [Cotesia typhae]|uniref:Phosphatidylinositide phosphatase SAC2 n=1 Tax=Cotesia typhae TaxID=2053667 RepID=A0A8J5QP11_9HYME|nr:hypothetical protein G9C98_008512 [Cotesia typhae]
MHFENVSILINALSDILGEMGYCWRDSHGSICSQQGVFRINCIDCLDRTNVVQTAIAKTVMEMQFSKLGLIPPDGTLPSNIRQTFQSLWANNGDIISKQYAGTNALKGDYTRTGERKFTGLMKDGVNSANRYYQQHFLDETYQAAIDITLGSVQTSKYRFNVRKKQLVKKYFKREPKKKTMLLRQFMLNYSLKIARNFLISNSEAILGSWGLIDADPVTGNPNETEMDTILILTKDSYYIADYDDQIDKVTNYQQVLLSEIEMIEFGQPELSTSFFKNKQHHCIRINYCVNNESGYYHMFRCTNLRFFNNMAVVIKTDEEAVESLRAICEAFSVAIEIAALPEIPVKIVNKSYRQKSSSDKIEQNTQSKVVFTIDRCEPGIEAENYDFDNHSYDDSHENFEEDGSKVESVIQSISPLENNSSNPKITILNTDGQEKDEKEKIIPPSTLNLVKKISHSSSEVDGDTDSRNFIEVDKNGERKSASLEEGLPKNNITSSQSESALKSIKSNITNVTSPVATTAKEILSPFSKFAKGVQTFGANLDPRKLKSHQGTVSKTLSDHHLDQREKLLERWKGCKSMLIAL